MPRLWTLAASRRQTAPEFSTKPGELEMMHLHYLHFFAAPAVFAISCTLAGFGGTAPQPASVQVPVIVPCVGAVPERPGFDIRRGPVAGRKGCGAGRAY